MSGHSVSAAHEKTIEPFADRLREPRRIRASVRLRQFRRTHLIQYGHRDRRAERARPTLQGTTGMPRRQRPPRTRQRRVFPPGRWVQRIRGVRT